MDISSSDPVSAQYAVSVEKLSQNAVKASGEAAVQLIQSAGAAAPPPPGPNGEGTHINTYA
jgi:hypothetical protein